MFEKIVLAIAIACSLYLNIQVKTTQRVAETGVVPQVEAAEEVREAVLPKA
jgi:hypothetical protein